MAAMRLHLWGVVVAISLLTAGSLIAESAPQDVTSQREEAIQATVDVNNRIAFCRQLMREKNYDGASAMLEALYEHDPENSLIVNLLVQCYDQLRYNEKAEEIISRHIQSHPDNVNFRLTYAEIIARQGDLKRAAVEYRKALDLTGTENLLRVQSIVQSMVTNAMDDQALELIERIRAEKQDTTLFVLQKGEVLERQRKYKEAASEYYRVLPDTTQVGNTAEKKLLALLEFADSSEETRTFLLSHPDFKRNARALSILSTYYLISRQLSNAFDLTIMEDSLEGSSGAPAIVYMHRCFERRLYQEVVRMGEYVMGKYRDTPVITPAYYTYAEALRSLGRYDDALAVYDTVFARIEPKRERAEALYSIGRIYLEDTHDYERALVYFDSVATHFPYGLNYLRSMLGIPYAYLRMGDLDRAEQEFEKLAAKRLNDDMLEEVTYHIGLVNFYQKQVDSAQGIFDKLLVDFPRGLYVNDALQLSMVINEAEGYPTVLYDFSNALLFEERRMFDSSLAVFERIAALDSPVLADLALYRISGIHLNLRDSVGTLDAIDRLIENYPESYYMPYGMKIKADILATGKDRTIEARDLYRTLLQDYPNYPFATEVRERLRALDETPGSA